MHLNGEIVKMSFECEKCRKWASGLKIDDSEEKNGP